MISQECHRSLPIGRGVFENWKYPLAFVVTDSTISGENLKLHVQKCLETFEEKGVKIIATVCDQGSNNRKCYTSLGVTKKNSVFCIFWKEGICLFRYTAFSEIIQKYFIKS
jgi:hypothetical protein